MNRVLTATYHAVYPDAVEGDDLVLLTAPLASTAEVEALFSAGVIDIESALPTALHSLGMSAHDIEGALKRRLQADAAGTDTKLLEAQTASRIGDADVALKAAQTAKTEQEALVTREMIAKTKADTAKVKHDAAAPYPSASAGASSSSASKK